MARQLCAARDGVHGLVWRSQGVGDWAPLQELSTTLQRAESLGRPGGQAGQKARLQAAARYVRMEIGRSE